MISRKWRKMSKNCRHRFIYHIDKIDSRCTTGFATKSPKNTMLKSIVLEPSFCYDVLEDRIEVASGRVEVETEGEGLSFTSNFGQHYGEIMETWKKDVKRLEELPLYITKSYNAIPIFCGWNDNGENNFPEYFRGFKHLKKPSL